MYIRPRIIPCLTMQHQDLVKTISFKKPRYIGDPVNTVKIFNNKDVDEMCIIDITATREKRQPDFDYLLEIASEAFVPLCYIGGVKKLDDAKRIFRLGYEKIGVNSLLYENPDEVKRIAEYVGHQSVVASIDVKTDYLGRKCVWIYGGSQSTKESPVVAVGRALNAGVGEILLNSIDRDGSMKGFDCALVQSISEVVDVPVIACGGAGCLDDIKTVLSNGRADAVAIGSFFVYYGKNRAVLINTPSEDELYQSGIFM